MSNDDQTLRVIIDHLAMALEPLRTGVSSLEEFQNLMGRLGWDVESLPPAFQALGQSVSDLVDAAEALGDGATLPEIRQVIDQSGRFFQAIKAVGEAPAGVDGAEFLRDVPRALFDLLLVEHMIDRLPYVYNTLRMAGVITNEIHAARPGRTPYSVAEIHYDRFIDLFSEPETLPRRIYGWGTPDYRHDTFGEHIVGLLGNLRFAPHLRAPRSASQADGPLIHHTDHGGQYTCDDFRDELAKHGIECSMSGSANCYDNAVVESFFGLLKRERVNRVRYRTRDEARADVFEYVEVFYNRKRRHGYLCNVSPADFEEQAAGSFGAVH